MFQKDELISLYQIVENGSYKGKDIEFIHSLMNKIKKNIEKKEKSGN